MLEHDYSEQVARIRAISDARNGRRAEKRTANAESNRELMPNVAEIVDKMTVTFGKVKVTGAIDYETGHKAGDLL